MPTNPFNAPISFDYKPLGLEAFAKPLEEMQKQYDTTKAAVESATYDINALSADKETKDKIIQELEAKRDELANNLSTTKNYRQAASKLMELNKLYKEHPEIKALNAEYQATMDWVKEGDERAKKGEINKEYWEQHKANKLAEYANQGGLWGNEAKEKGLSYDPSMKSYRSVDRSTLGQDLEKEIQDRMLEIGKATPEQMKDIATAHGMDLSNFQWVTSEGKINYKAIDELKKNMAQNILNQPRYVQYLNEVANIKAESEKFRNPEQYEDWKRSQYAEHLQEVDTKIKHTQELAAKGNKEAKTYLESPEFKEAIASRDALKEDIETGNLSDSKAHQIFKNNYTSDYVNKNAYQTADIFDYWKKDVEKKWTNMSNAQLGMYGFGDDGQEIKPVESFVTPDMYSEPHTTKSLLEQYKDSKNTIQGSVKQVNQITAGLFQKALPKANAYQQAKEVNALYNAKVGAKDFNDFVRRYKQFGGSITDLKILGGISHSMNDVSDLKNMQKVAFTLNEASSDLHTINSIHKKAVENVEKSPEFIQELEKAGSSKIFTAHITDPDARAKLLVDMKTSGLGMGATLNDYAKAKGYKSVSDALNKGFKFPSYLGNVGLFGMSGNINTLYNEKKKEFIDKNLSTSTFGAEVHILGSTKEAKALQALTNDKVDLLVGGKSGTHIENMKPLYGSNFKGKPGFDENGSFVGKKVGQAVLGIDNGSVYFSVPISYLGEDKKEHRTTIKMLPRKGTVASGELKTIVKNFAKHLPNDVEHQKDREMLANAMFSLENPNSNINDSYVNSLATNSKEPVTIYQFNYNGHKIRAVKNSTSTSETKGGNNQYYTAEIFDGKQWKKLNSAYTGKPLETTDLSTLRSELGEIYLP